MHEKQKVFTNPDVGTMPFALQSVGTTYSDEAYHFMRPCSRVDVIEFVISGKGTVETSSGTFHPCAGDSYLLRVGEWHNYYADPDAPWEKIWINVMGTLPTHILDSYGFHKSMLFPKLDLSSYIKQIQQISCTDFTDMNKMYDQCCTIFLHLCQHARQSLSTADHVPRIPYSIAQLKNYIDLHLDEDLTLEKCNSITCLSTSQTIRSFRQAYGVPPYGYLNQQRMEAAKMLLSTSPLSIQEIATQVGFEDPNYFSKYFRKKFGESPKNFRDSQQ